MADKKWKSFERLVAAINKVVLRGADVKWNERIGGRQFDVVIRFRMGELYDYLTVIECRDEQRPVEVGDIDAFITKARDAGAHKAIVVAASGFQSGALQVAERHGIELYTLTEVQSVPEEFLSDRLIPALSVYSFSFSTPGGGTFDFPERPNETDFFVKNTRIQFGERRSTIGDLVRQHCRSNLLPKHEEQQAIIPFAAGTTITRPDTEETLEVSSLSFKYRIISARLMKPSEQRVDPHVFSTAYAVRNARTGETKTVPAVAVLPGLDTQFEAGRFYRDTATNFKYLCEAAEGERATMYMVECYQHGEALQARMTMSTAHATHYEPVRDSNEIARLEKMYRLNPDNRHP